MKYIKKRKKIIPPHTACYWLECTEKCENTWQLNGHIKKHLDRYFEDNISEVYNCSWVDCDFQTEESDELQRHVYYHGYYSTILMLGKHECELHPNIPKCNAQPKINVPELKTDFRCEWRDCVRSFLSIIEFQDHIEQHGNFEYEVQKTPETPRPKVECNWNYCKMKLDNRYRLIEHMSTHSNKKQVGCFHCGEIYRTRTSLFDHLRRQPQNNTQKYQCVQCFKYFSTSKLMRMHVLKHVNCYKCSMCDMSCSSASSLATHVRYRHLKDKPFKCPECEHRCVRESDLKKHIHFIHNKLVHRCDQAGCNYNVRSYNLLRRHFLEVHENNPFIYVCHCCEKAFKSGKSLSFHLTKKHDIQLPSGHKRFTYRVNENGFYRLETMRIESLEVTKQILSPNPLEISEVTQDSNYEIVTMTNKHDERTIVSHDTTDSRPACEVVISLPNM